MLTILFWAWVGLWYLIICRILVFAFPVFFQVATSTKKYRKEVLKDIEKYPIVALVSTIGSGVTVPVGILWFIVSFPFKMLGKLIYD